jgi:hypothetical protein
MNYTGGHLAGYYNVEFDGQSFELAVNATDAECIVSEVDEILQFFIVQIDF